MTGTRQVLEYGATSEVLCPEKLNFSDDIERTLEFFSALRKDVAEAEEHGQSVFVNMHQVTRISPEAAICLRAEVDRLTWARSRTLVWGQPTREEPNAALNAAGFQWRAAVVPKARMGLSKPLLVSPQVISDGSSPVLHVQSGFVGQRSDRHVTEVIDENFDAVVGGAVSDLSKPEFKKLRVALVTALFEVVYNVETHAYPDDVLSDAFPANQVQREFDWWVFCTGLTKTQAVKRSSVEELVICTLDHGTSIPQNIRNGIKNGQAQIVSTKSLRASPDPNQGEQDDIELLRLLLNGLVQRSERQSYGTGMASLRDVVDEGIGYEMRIVSGAASIIYRLDKSGRQTTEEATTLETPFKGTFISWRIKRKDLKS